MTNLNASKKKSGNLLNAPRIIPSIAIMKANRDIVHSAIIPTSNNCQSVEFSRVVRQNCRSLKYFCTNFVIFIGTRKNLSRWANEGRIQMHSLGLLLLCNLYAMIRHHRCMFQAPRKIWYPTFLYSHVYELIFIQVWRNSFSNNTKENLPFYVE